MVSWQLVSALTQTWSDQPLRSALLHALAQKLQRKTILNHFKDQVKVSWDELYRSLSPGKIHWSVFVLSEQAVYPWLYYVVISVLVFVELLLVSIFLVKPATLSSVGKISHKYLPEQSIVSALGIFHGPNLLFFIADYRLVRRWLIL